MANNHSDAVKELLDILEPFDDEDRTRLLDGVAVLFGVARASSSNRSGVQHTGVAGGNGNEDAAGGDTDEPAPYFASKDPKFKIEELAVAARYRHQSQGLESHTKEDLQEIFNQASVNFDSKNFARDLDNAKTAGLFLRGDEIKLTYNGSNFVDALPDREAAAKFKKKAKTRKKAKKTAKKKAGKNKS